MSYVRMAILSAAAICLLPFATPAIAELGHPSGCVGCPPVEVSGPTQGPEQEGAPAIGPMLNMGFPPGATAQAPATRAQGRPRAKWRHRQVWDPRVYHIVRP
jgi:hypothetical protein